MPTPKTDPVIEQARAAADKVRALADNALTRLEEKKKSLLNGLGNPRPNLSLEVAQRQIEVEALEARVAAADAAVEHAIADLPRRERNREAAEEIEEEIAKLDADIEAATETLRRLQSQRAEKQADATAARHRASRTFDQLAHNAKTESAAAEKADADAAWIRQADAAMIARRAALEAAR